MQKTIELKAETSVKATLRGEQEISLSCSFTVAYGKRTATVTVEDLPQDIRAKVGQALQEALQTCEQRGLYAAHKAAIEAAIVAARHQEEV